MQEERVEDSAVRLAQSQAKEKARRERVAREGTEAAYRETLEVFVALEEIGAKVAQEVPLEARRPESGRVVMAVEARRASAFIELLDQELQVRQSHRRPAPDDDEWVQGERWEAILDLDEQDHWGWRVRNEPNLLSNRDLANRVLEKVLKKNAA
ncbi:MAG TPA: hypothetical protein VGG03_22070 [Thermoanaerobaculia bacterium]|jgi:hypothetical protein